MSGFVKAWSKRSALFCTEWDTRLHFTNPKEPKITPSDRKNTDMALNFYIFYFWVLKISAASSLLWPLMRAFYFVFFWSLWPGGSQNSEWTWPAGECGQEGRQGVQETLQTNVRHSGDLRRVRKFSCDFHRSVDISSCFITRILAWLLNSEAR